MGKGTVIAIVVVVTVAVVIVAIALIATSLKRLDSTEMGIQYDTVSKTLADEVKDPGLHLGPVGYSFVTAPSVFQSIKSLVKCLNEDGILIEVSITYQYRLVSQHYRDTIVQFKTADEFVRTLQSVGEEAVHEVCSNFTTSNIQTERDRFTKAIRSLIRDKFNKLHVAVSGVQISNYNRPDNFEKAVETKETAREDIVVAKQERNKKLVVADTAVKVAKTQANITLESAMSYKRSRVVQATNKALTITAEFEAEIETYNAIRSSLNLTTEGVLSYMGVRVLEKSPNPVNIAVESPAKFSYTKP